MLEQLQADTLFEGRQPALALAVGRRPGDRIARVGSSVWRPARRWGRQRRYAAGAARARLYLQRMWQNEGEVAAFIGGEGESLAVPEAELHHSRPLVRRRERRARLAENRRRGGRHAAHCGHFRRAGHR
ncbi:hypothetical protein M8494_00680 [Serratia ureilytica]